MQLWFTIQIVAILTDAIETRIDTFVVDSTTVDIEEGALGQGVRTETSRSGRRIEYCQYNECTRQTNDPSCNASVPPASSNWSFLLNSHFLLLSTCVLLRKRPVDFWPAVDAFSGCWRVSIKYVRTKSLEFDDTNLTPSPPFPMSLLSCNMYIPL